MKIEYDAAKDRENVRKHGLPFGLAAFANWPEALIRPDVCRDYSEDRFIAYVPLGGRLHVICFTDRGDARRIISFRKANEREARIYAKAADR